MRLILLITLTFLALGPAISPARAAEKVAVRGGEHEGYSRVVFDWPGGVSYTLDKSQKGRLLVTFAKAADLAAPSVSLSRVPSARVLQSNPLKIELSIPADAKIRDLRTASRVVIDVYGSPQKKAEQKSEKKLEAKKPEAKKPEPEKTAQVEPAGGEKKGAESKTTPPVKAEEKPAVKELEKLAAAVSVPAKPAEAEKPKDIKLKPSATPTQINLSSTRNFGLAVFSDGGRLFVVNDQSGLLVEPKPSGPLADKMNPPAAIETRQGSVTAFSLPENQKILGQGGGLVWKILVSPDLKPAQPIDPKRDVPSKEKERDGRIVWPLGSARAILDFTHPGTGQLVKAVTVENADRLGGPLRRFVDFDVLDSSVGLAIVPKVDDLEVKLVKGDVEISRPGGLTLADDESLGRAAAPAISLGASSQRVYDFKNWQLGGLKAVPENRSILLGGLKGMSEGARIENMLSLAKMYLSNGMAPEAQGMLRMALTDMPALKDSPEFRALRGAAFALNFNSEAAFADFSAETLKPFEEVAYWKAAAVANLGDWQLAAQIMPRVPGAVADYPPELQNRLGLVLAEVALRAGDVPLAEKFLALVQAHEKSLRTPQKAALAYLRGEAARQNGKLDETVKLWEPLTKGEDDLYRAKAGLALTRLNVDRKKLTPGKAIDNLERLRYAWRGDELEAQVNAWLGRTYFESGDYIKGLKIMRDAITFVPETELAKRIAGDMSDTFTGLFLGETLDKVSPLDAVALYNQFTELVPPDERGDMIVERLAEHLAKADLLERSADLLDHQVQHRLQGEKAYRVAERLAAIRLLDGKPDKAIAALNLAQQKFSELPDEMKTEARTRKLSLLRARALSKQGHPDKAVAMLNDLPPSPETNALRADIAWKAGYWDDAAEALGDVILDQNISLTRPLDDKSTALIMQRAIALNLASNRIALSQMREKYTDLMNQTDKAKIFEVITRPRQSGSLADRDTLLGVVREVDLFNDFLNSYKSMKEPLSSETGKGG